MSVENSNSVMNIVDAIADVVQRHGQYDFRPDSKGYFFRIATLCGLTVQFEGTSVRRVTTHDLDLQCHTTPDTSSPHFSHGSSSHLERWHRKILQFDRFFCTDSVVDLPLAQAA